jgi:hypothetical protein
VQLISVHLAAHGHAMRVTLEADSVGTVWPLSWCPWAQAGMVKAGPGTVGKEAPAESFKPRSGEHTIQIRTV